MCRKTNYSGKKDHHTLSFQLRWRMETQLESYHTALCVLLWSLKFVPRIISYLKWGKIKSQVIWQNSKYHSVYGLGNNWRRFKIRKPFRLFNNMRYDLKHGLTRSSGKWGWTGIGWIESVKIRHGLAEDWVGRCDVESSDSKVQRGVIQWNEKQV